MSRIRSKVKGQWFTWWKGEDGLWRCAECDWRGRVKSTMPGIGESRDLAYQDLTGGAND